MAYPKVELLLRSLKWNLQGLSYQVRCDRLERSSSTLWFVKLGNDCSL